MCEIITKKITIFKTFTNILTLNMEIDLKLYTKSSTYAFADSSVTDSILFSFDNFLSALRE